MDQLRVVVAKPLDSDYVEHIRAAEPRIDLVIEPDLLPPMRWPSDHEGDPAFQRTPEQQARFEELVDSADVLYGIPDTKPASLARTVRANPRLKWVQTMAAGGGSQVKAAGLTDEELARVIFTTSAGVHAGTLAEFALFGVLAGAKDLPQLLEHKARHYWSPSRWVMKQVSDMTVVVIGLGSIGQECAKRFAGHRRQPLDQAGFRRVEAVYLRPDRRSRRGGGRAGQRAAGCGRHRGTHQP